MRGPCHHRPKFWENILSSDIFRKEHLISGGDLNFSLGHSESWGHHAEFDPQSEFFENILEAHNLVDIPLEKVLPTWRNNRAREDSLAKRLDHFLLKEGLLNIGLNLKQWVGFGGLSDYLPIYFEITGRIDKPKGPFKFNSSSLKDASYARLVTNFWKAHPADARGSVAEGFMHNLKELKKLSKIWAHNKRV